MQERQLRICWYMQLSRRSRLLVVFAFALNLILLHADEQALIARPLHSKRESQANQSCEVVQAPRRRLEIDNNVDLRPKDGGDVDVIQVGILVRKLYAIQVKEGMYSADIVLTLRWTDERVSELVPEGSDHVALSSEAASKALWVPNVIPTNRDILGLEEISSATIIRREGENNVERTKRFMVRMRQPYNLQAYPFDEQTLSVVVASSKYMYTEVEMEAMEDENFKGCADGVMGTQPWDLLGYKMRVIREQTASLKKSRCLMELTIRRKSRSITENTIVPELLLIFIAWTVFFLPMVIQYVVPRVATCLVCFLTMAQFSSKTATMLPDTGDLTWITVWEQCCTFLMFEVSLFNVCTEIVYHKLEYTAVALNLRFEMSMCIAGLAVFFWAMTNINKSGEGLVFMCMVARTSVTATMLFWLGRAAFQSLLEYRRRRNALLEEEAEKQAPSNIEMSDRSNQVSKAKSGDWW